MRKSALALALIGAMLSLSGCYRHHVGGYGDHGYHHGGDHGGGGDYHHGSGH